MYRKKIEELVKWKNSSDRKPLILNGARQTGKTWLLKEFGKLHYEKSVYLNLENNETMKGVFSVDLNPRRIVEEISIETGVKIESGNTLIILDEIQEIPRALTALKYFNEDAPEFHIAVAGSFLGIALHQGTSKISQYLEVSDGVLKKFAQF
jgi:predicted AAA+ superfamily ATPase